MLDEYNDILYEYNIINNIPILHPLKNNNLFFSPRQDIATPDIVLNFLKKYDYNDITIKNESFKYLKINLNKKYKNDVKALYCYLIIDEYTYNKINIDNSDNLDINFLLEWLINIDRDNNFIITCPILKYNDVYYSINNDDNEISIVNIIDINNNINVILQLIMNNCYTICDNYIIIISLFQKNKINKKKFINYINILNKLDYKYTKNIWIYFMNIHKIFSACDFPYCYLSRTPYKIDKEIVLLFINKCFNNIYLESEYIYDSFLFTSLLSNSYPYTDRNFILNNNTNISKCLWETNSIIEIDYNNLYKKALFIPDLYGLFASISSVNSMWKYWNENKSILLNTILNRFDKKYNYAIIEILNNLFELYNNGYDNRNIRKNRIRQIWLYAITELDISKKIIPQLLNIAIIKKNNVKLKNIPYIFILNIYDIYNINFFQKNLFIVDIKNNAFIYKNSSYYELIKKNNNDNIYNFNKNIIKKKIIYILMCIYKKFNMFNKNINLNNNYQKGMCLIEYYKDNLYKFI